MILCLPEVITDAEHRQLRAWIDGATFADGGQTVGQALADIKHNRELTAVDPVMARVTALVRDALSRNEVFLAAARPRTMAAVMINRYGPGMFYGAHVDAPIIGHPNLLRSDLSFTLFLAAPEDYDGGELVFEQAGQSQSFKLPARAAIVYPTGQLHRVDTVTRGERLAVVGWIQSLVRDPLVRELMFDVAEAERLLRGNPAMAGALATVHRVQAGLVRRYAAP